MLKRSLFDSQPSKTRQLNGYPRTFGYGVNWQRMQVVLAGKGEAIMQPCPVVDRTTGEIIICCQEIRGGLANLLKNEWHGRCLILRSTDDGVTCVCAAGDHRERRAFRRRPGRRHSTANWHISYSRLFQGRLPRDLQ